MRFRQSFRQSAKKHSNPFLRGKKVRRDKGFQKSSSELTTLFQDRLVVTTSITLHIYGHYTTRARIRQDETGLFCVFSHAHDTRVHFGVEFAKRGRGVARKKPRGGHPLKGFSFFATHGSRLRRAGRRDSRFHDTRVGFPIASPPWPPPSTRAKFSSLLLHPLHFCVRSCIIIVDAGCPHTAKVRKKPFVAGKRTFVCRLRRTDIFPTLGRKSPKTQGGFLPFSGISEEII